MLKERHRPAQSAPGDRYTTSLPVRRSSPSTKTTGENSSCLLPLIQDLPDTAKDTIKAALLKLDPRPQTEENAEG